MSDDNDNSPKPVTVTASEIQDVEGVLESLGGFGKFQVVLLVALLSFEIPLAFVAFAPIFTGKNPNEWMCDNDTVFKTDPDFCNCNGTLFTHGSSIVSEWGLVCELSWVSDFTTTLQMLGMVFGNVVMGQFADWYGRRWTFLGTIGWLSSGTILSSLAPNIYIYGIARLMCGVGFAGYTFLSVTYAMEFMTPSWRSICASVGPMGEGIMLLGVLGYYCQDSWRTLYLISAVPYVFILVVFPFLPESPRWLLRNKKIVEAHKVFETISKLNGTSPIEIETLWRIADCEQTGQQEQVKKISYIEFFKNKEVRFVTLCLMMIWGCWALMYFGITFNIKNLGGNPFMNVIFIGLCDAVGYPCSYLLNSMCTRRRSLAVFMTGAAVFLVTLALVYIFLDKSDDGDPMIILGLCFAGKFFAAGARASARTLTGESFPTSVRNMGYGMVGLAAALVALVAPQLAYLGARWPSVPLFVFAGCSFIGACASFLLRETKGQPLNEEVTKKRDRRLSISSIVASVRRLSTSSARK